jgi:hypothetical protein
MTKRSRNIAASIRARLLERSRQRQEDFQLVLQRYSAERFLFRVGDSEYREQFVLKGAMLFALWGGSLYRATRELDLTGYMPNDPVRLVGAIQEICEVECSEDGIVFLPQTVRGEPIRSDSDYGGFRVRLEAHLENAKIRLQVDIGFGDAIIPEPEETEYPTLLEVPPPRICAYPREAVVAEKLHAIRQ